MAFERFIERVNRVLTPVGMAAVIAMTVVVTANVLGRAIFNTPILGTVDIVSFAGAIMVSFIASYTQATKQNIAVGIVVDQFSPRVQAIIDACTLLLSVVIIGFLVWTSYVRAQDMLIAHEETQIIRVIRAPFRYVWVFGLFTLFVVLVGQFVISLKKVVKR